MNAALSHTTVLLDEAIDALVTDSDGIYVDGTFGRGGHTRLLLTRLREQAQVFAFDRDPQAIAAGQALVNEDPRLSLVHSDFGAMEAVLEAKGVVGQVNGILLDLGVSSPQLDDPERGFSFMQDGPLDMRMDNATGQSAAEWLALASEADIVRVLKEYGEERFARRIAKKILAEREIKLLTRTTELVSLIESAVPVREKGKHPATRTFQAIRIQVNAELQQLATLLEQSLRLLQPGGRLVVISFHSLEDRIVKRFIQRYEKGEALPRHLPVQDVQLNRQLKTVQKPVKASEQEVSANTRARSAIMRVAEKL